MTKKKKAPSTKALKPGEAHEKKVNKVVKHLYPNSLVEENVKRPGVISRGTRQIDTLLHDNEKLIDFEAKDYKRNVGIDAIAKYAFKVEDEQADSGVMVSTSPYSDTAINTAKHHNVKLTHLVDTADSQNRVGIAQKTLIIDKMVRSLYMRIQHNSLEQISLPTNLAGVELENDDGKRIKAYNAFQQTWNKGTCPDDNGEHVLVLQNQPVVMTDGRVVRVARFCFIYVVVTVYRKGEWRVQEANGLYNVIENSFATRGMTSANLSVEEINKWPEISEDEAKNTTFGIELAVKSILPDTPPSTTEQP